MPKMLAVIIAAGCVLSIQAPAHAKDLYCVISEGKQVIGVFPLDKAHVEQCRFASQSAQRASGHGDSFRIVCNPGSRVKPNQMDAVDIGAVNQDSGTIVTRCK